MSNAEKLLIEDAEMTINMCKSIMQTPDLSGLTLDKLTVRILNIENSLAVAKQDIAIRELKGELFHA